MKAMLAGLLLLCTLCSYAAEEVIHLNAARNKPEVVVTLPANLTTGYQWTLSSYDKKRLKLISSQYVVSKTKRMGSGGHMVFKFALNKGQSYPKTTHMSFIYARPWDPTSAYLTRTVVHFKPKR